MELPVFTFRIKYPMKRIGERGEGKWQRISWEQGLDEVAERLKEVKAKAMVIARAITVSTKRTAQKVIIKRTLSAIS